MKSIIEDVLGLDYRIINPKLVDENEYREFVNKKQNLGYSCELEGGAGRLIEDLEIGEKINSLIVFFIPYLSEENKKVSGNISYYARGLDYHIKVKFKLDSLINKLQTLHPENKFYFQSDIGELNERFYAGESGLCILGRNGNMIHSKYGSYGNLAIIYSDLIIKEYKTPKKNCLGCGICQKKCPTNAIKTDGINNSNVCISYLTQKKGLLKKHEIKLIKESGYIFGCDICQNVCPMNDNVVYINCQEDYVNNLRADDLSKLSNKQFKNFYKEKAFSWRGKAVLQRNIDIIQ